MTLTAINILKRLNVNKMHYQYASPADETCKCDFHLQMWTLYISGKKFFISTIGQMSKVLIIPKAVV